MQREMMPQAVRNEVAALERSRRRLQRLIAFVMEQGRKWSIELEVRRLRGILHHEIAKVPRGKRTAVQRRLKAAL